MTVASGGCSCAAAAVSVTLPAVLSAVMSGCALAQPGSVSTSRSTARRNDTVFLLIIASLFSVFLSSVFIISPIYRLSTKSFRNVVPWFLFFRCDGLLRLHFRGGCDKLLTVSTDIVLYFRNRKLDRQEQH